MSQARLLLTSEKVVRFTGNTRVDFEIISAFLKLESGPGPAIVDLIELRGSSLIHLDCQFVSEANAEELKVCTSLHLVF